MNLMKIMKLLLNIYCLLISADCVFVNTVNTEVVSCIVMYSVIVLIIILVIVITVGKIIC